MAKKEKTAEDTGKPSKDIYFIANSEDVSQEMAEFLRDKVYITINGAFRKFKNFVKMAFTNQRQFELAKDTFWRLPRDQQENFVIGGDEVPIELSLLADYDNAFLVGYDDIRIAALTKEYKKAENITTQLSKFVIS